MPDIALMEIAGARPAKPSKYTSLATLKWIGGLQTQRSPFASIDSRYNSKFLGGKPDALIAGSNVELSNKLTLQRRPGLVAYGTASIPTPDFLFIYQQASLANFISLADPTFAIYPQANLQLVVDTATDGTNAPGNLYNYSPTYAGIILNKALLSQQTSLSTVVNTMYIGNGVDLKKFVGANLLTQSNSYGVAPWSSLGATITPNTTDTTDPTGANKATKIVFTSSGSSATSYVLQTVKPNYTPVSLNTFTFSVWAKSDTAGAKVFLQMNDDVGNILINTQQTFTTGWKLYQVTGVAGNGAASIAVMINDPSSTLDKYFFYGAQLEVGGPATPTTITLNKPNGVYLWGIQAPVAAPTFTFAPQFGSTGKTWLPGTLYSQTTGSITEVAQAGTLATAVVINNITYAVGAVYTATIAGGAGNLKGRYFSCLSTSSSGLTSNNQTLGTKNPTGFPGFLCLASNATTITLYNPGATLQAPTGTNTATLLDSVVDSNGDLQVAYTPGKSGSSQPIWTPVVGQATQDGLQNLIVQSASAQANSNTVTVTLPANVTLGNTKIIVVALANTPGSTPAAATLVDSSGDSPTLLSQKAVSNIQIFLYYVLSATAGATTITITVGGSSASWVGIAEMSNQTATDGTAGTNSAQRSPSVIFTTGQTTTTGTDDVLFTFGTFAVPNGTQGFSVGNLPSGYQAILGQPPTAVGTGFWNMTLGFQIETIAATYNPSWLITNPTLNSNDGYMGITAAFTSSVGTLVWYNFGPKGVTSTSALGYQWGYAHVNIYTGHRSNISPLSVSSGNFAGQAVTVTGFGMQISQSGAAGADPQVDAIEVYRNTDGGGFWYQIPPALMTGMTGTVTDAKGTVYLANPGTTLSPGTWSFIDAVPDSSLNTQIYGAIGLLNSVPPAGLTDLEFFDRRLWGSVGNTLYYATAQDDANLLNVLQNGVSPESWEPTNYIPFNSPIVRIVTTGIGLFVFTTTDVWTVSGTNLNYIPTRALAGVGIGTYNAVCIDGSIMMVQTRDRQCLTLSIGHGINEIGFVIGDSIETNINPMTAYIARHVKGSQDNAFYLGDGATGWYRLNPNQSGASAQGEQATVWSPFATITNGCGALASLEVNPGVKLLLVGRVGTGTGPILNRDITVFQDNGTSYTWSATIGSIMLALAGTLAAVESITTEMTGATATQCAVGVLLDEISGTFETLGGTTTNPTPDPPQLVKSISVLSNRFYLSTGPVPPVCRHIQINLSGTAVNTKDELLALTIRGCIINEQD